MLSEVCRPAAGVEMEKCVEWSRAPQSAVKEGWGNLALHFPATSLVILFVVH